MKLMYNPITINIDVNRLIRLNLTIEEYLICHILQINEIEGYRVYTKQVGKPGKYLFDRLFNKEYIRIKDEEKSKYNLKNVELTKKFHEGMKKKSTMVDDWIDEWLDLWPRGMKSGGYYIRGNRRVVLFKMKLFTKVYPEFNKEVIFNATKQYLNRMAADGFRYSKLSQYFIMKENVSVLADECQAILDENREKVELENNGGGGYGEQEL